MELNTKAATPPAPAEKPRKEEKHKTSYHVDTKRDEDTYQGFQSKDPIVSIPVADKPPISTGHGANYVKHRTSYAETLMHLFKGNVGSGMFAMGDAFRNAGLFLAPCLTLFLGVICVHSQHLLLKASQEMMRRTNSDTAPDFAETVELCFSTGPPALRRFSTLMRRLVNIFLCVTQLGFCCIYFVFISKNVKLVADNYFKIGVDLWMAIILVPILLSALVRNLKFLAPLSLVANTFMICGIGITLYFTSQNLPNISTTDYVASPYTIPLYFGTAIFAFEGIGLVLPLRNEMKKPEHFGGTFGVLNIGMTVVTILLIVIGFLSYLRYGDGIEGSVTLNFDSNSILAQAVQIVLACGVLLGYALQFYIPIDIMWPGLVDLIGPIKWPVLGELGFRALLVFVTFILAEAIPFLDLFISLVGAISSTALALIFPPILELVISGQAAQRNWWLIFKNGFTILIGFLGFLTGTYESINAIIKAYGQKY